MKEKIHMQLPWVGWEGSQVQRLKLPPRQKPQGKTEGRVEGQGEVLIYVLRCPKSGAVRYVGKTIEFIKRYRHHSIKDKKQSPKVKWITDLRSQGCLPIMEAIEMTTIAEWSDSEKFWIAFFRKSGCNILNVSRGGNGPGTTSEETKRKMSEVHKKRLSDPIELEKHRKTFHDPSAKANRSAAQKARFNDPESFQAYLESRKKLAKDPKWHESLRKGQKKRYENPEEREKNKQRCNEPWLRKLRSENSKAMWRDPDFKQRVSLNIREALKQKHNKQKAK